MSQQKYYRAIYSFHDNVYVNSEINFKCTYIEMLAWLERLLSGPITATLTRETETSITVLNEMNYKSKLRFILAKKSQKHLTHFHIDLASSVYYNVIVCLLH